MGRINWLKSVFERNFEAGEWADVLWLVTQAGSADEWMGKDWKSGSDLTARSPLPHICWRKQECLQRPDWAAVMSLPAICPENLLSGGCRDRLQIRDSVFFICCGAEGSPSKVRTSLRPARSQDWSLWWCPGLGWCKYRGEVLPPPYPRRPPPPLIGGHPPEELGILQTTQGVQTGSQALPNERQTCLSRTDRLHPSLRSGVQQLWIEPQPVVGPSESSQPGCGNASTETAHHVLDHTQDGELTYLFVVVRQHVAHGDNQWGESGPWLRLLLPTVFHQIETEDGEHETSVNHSWNLWKGVNVWRTCSAERVRVDSSCILSWETSKTPESAGRLGRGSHLEQTTVQKLASNSFKILEKRMSHSHTLASHFSMCFVH